MTQLINGVRMNERFTRIATTYFRFKDEKHVSEIQ